MAIFKGLATALITPFDKNDNIDYKAYEKLIEFQIQNKTDALVICGTTGEAASLTYKERKESIGFAVKVVADRIPVIAGAGSNSTALTIELINDAQKLDIAGLLLVTPYYNKTTQKGLMAHYAKACNSTDLPVIVYNVPGRTGFNIEPETVAKLSEIPNIVAIKEASGNIAQAGKLAHICNNIPNFTIYAGNDNEILPMLSLGAKGIISVLGNIAPKNTHDMVMHFLNGNFDKAKQLQLKAMPLVQALFCELSPIPTKYILNSMGFNVGGCRLPLTDDMDSINIEFINKAIKNYELI